MHSPRRVDGELNVLATRSANVTLSFCTSTLKPASRVIRLVNPADSLIRFAAILEPPSLAALLSLSPQSGVIGSRNFVRVLLELAPLTDGQMPVAAAAGYLELHYWRRPRNSQLVRNILRLEIKTSGPHKDEHVATGRAGKQMLRLPVVARRVARLALVFALIMYNLLLIFKQLAQTRPLVVQEALQGPKWWP